MNTSSVDKGSNLGGIGMLVNAMKTRSDRATKLQGRWNHMNDEEQHYFRDQFDAIRNINLAGGYDNNEKDYQKTINSFESQLGKFRTRKHHTDSAQTGTIQPISVERHGKEKRQRGGTKEAADKQKEGNTDKEEEEEQEEEETPLKKSSHKNKRKHRVDDEPGEATQDTTSTTATTTTTTTTTTTSSHAITHNLPPDILKKTFNIKVIARNNKQLREKWEYEYNSEMVQVHSKLFELLKYRVGVSSHGNFTFTVHIIF